MQRGRGWAGAGEHATCSRRSSSLKLPQLPSLSPKQKDHSSQLSDWPDSVSVPQAPNCWTRTAPSSKMRWQVHLHEPTAILSALSLACSPSTPRSPRAGPCPIRRWPVWPVGHKLDPACQHPGTGWQSEARKQKGAERKPTSLATAQILWWASQRKTP